MGISGDVRVSLVNLNDADAPKISSLYDKWPTGFLTQFSQLFVRSFKQSKTKMYSKFKIFETTFLCVLLSLIWFQLPKSENTLRDRMGVVSLLFIFSSEGLCEVLVCHWSSVRCHHPLMFSKKYNSKVKSQYLINSM